MFWPISKDALGSVEDTSITEALKEVEEEEKEVEEQVEVKEMTFINRLQERVNGTATKDDLAALKRKLEEGSWDNRHVVFHANK